MSSTLNLSYTFESTTPDGSGIASHGSYQFPLTSFSFTLGGATGSLLGASGNSTHVSQHSSGSDGYFLQAGLTGTSIGGLVQEVFRISLNDSTATAFATKSLPLSLPLRLVQRRRVVPHLRRPDLTTRSNTSSQVGSRRSNVSTVPCPNLRR